jgi:hypothetical protein
MIGYWREDLEFRRKQNGDTSPIVAVAPSADVLDAEATSYTAPPVLVWTERYVYFPVHWDGAWLGSAPRDPQRETQESIGDRY